MIEGCNNLIVHLTYNQPDRLERARQLFDEGTDPPFAQFDLDSRWVAAHLRDIADDLGTTSVWAHLPPSVPPAAARAMTLGDPPVLSLWPPQLELLNGTPNPLDPAVRRLVLSFPTSAGKTLMAQYIVAAHVASGAGSACVVVPTHSLGSGAPAGPRPAPVHDRRPGRGRRAARPAAARAALGGGHDAREAGRAPPARAEPDARASTRCT